MSDQNQSN